MNMLPIDCRCRVVAKLSNGNYGLIWWQYCWEPWMDGKNLYRNWHEQKSIDALFKQGNILTLGKDLESTKFEQGTEVELGESYEHFIKRYGHNGFRYHWNGRQWFLQEHPLENYFQMKVPDAADQIALFSFNSGESE